MSFFNLPHPFAISTKCFEKMGRLIGHIFAALVVLSSINAWIIKEPVQYVEETKMCVLSDGSEVKAEEKWYDEDVCVVYECNLDFDEWVYVKYTTGCEEVSVTNTDPDRVCQIEKNSGNFPECCPKPVCHDV